MMKIIIITQNAPLYLSQFLESFLKKLKELNHDLHGIIMFSPVSRKGILDEIRKRYNYYGLFSFLKMTMFISINKLLSICSSCFPFIGAFGPKNVVKKYGISLLGVGSINSRKFHEYIEKKNIELIISIATPVIFKKRLLQSPKLGCINYHTGLLPKYRGRQPLFWALLNNEKEVGISIHEMDERIDNGPIIVQKRIAVKAEDSLHNLYKKTINVGPDAIIEAINLLDNGVDQRIENDPNKATYNGFPEVSDGRKFRSLKKKFI